MNLIARLFTRRSVVVVNTFKRRTTDLEKARRETHLRLAIELGKPFPLRIPAFEDGVEMSGEAG